jgi:hypothetical protein
LSAEITDMHHYTQLRPLFLNKVWAHSAGGWWTGDTSTFLHLQETEAKQKVYGCRRGEVAYGKAQKCNSKHRRIRDQMRSINSGLWICKRNSPNIRCSSTW